MLWQRKRRRMSMCHHSTVVRGVSTLCAAFVRGKSITRPPTAPKMAAEQWYRYFIQSATRSAIMIVVALVLERVTLGMIEASTTRNPSIPCTRPYWSTTAM
jgi:hypothetical protein